MGFGVRRGHELLRMIRARNDSVPIVVLSSRGDELGKVQALDLGADDYVTKPFGMEELLARLRAALRHQLQVHGERPVFHPGDLSVDLVSCRPRNTTYSVYWCNMPAKCSPTVSCCVSYGTKALIRSICVSMCVSSGRRLRPILSAPSTS
jgi:Response regulator receiver domain